MASMALMDFVGWEKQYIKQVYMSQLYSYNNNDSTFSIGTAIKTKLLYHLKRKISRGYDTSIILIISCIQHSVLYCNYVISEDDSLALLTQHQQHFIQTKPYNPPFLIKLTFSFSLICFNSAAILLILKCKTEMSWMCNTQTGWCLDNPHFILQLSSPFDRLMKPPFIKWLSAKLQKSWLVLWFIWA